MPALEDFNCGTDEAPDKSATVILQVDRIFPEAEGVTLSGPGIRDTVSILVDGVANDFWRQRQRQQALFPRGVDILFTAGDRFVGLPRTTMVEI